MAQTVRRGSLLLASLLCAGGVVGCGCGDDDDDDDDHVADAGLDASQDAALDAGTDAAPDAAADAAVEPLPRLDPTTIPQFEAPLIIPPAMPYETRTAEGTDYEIAARQFQQQILPEGLPPTTVWGYGRASDPQPGGDQPSTFNYPAFTIEARTGETVRVRWINGLVDDDGAYRPHILPVDQTLHWANPGSHSDHEGYDPTPYQGPVPIVTHLHGGHVASASDGFPEAWFLPDATDIPEHYRRHGAHYDSVEDVGPGAALFEYALDQRASTLWFHDHALGITRLNVYAGMAGFFLIRDDEEDALDLPGPAPAVDDPDGTHYYEIPIVVQDRTFYEDGSLYYPSSRAEFDEYEGPYAPDTEISPIWNPEFFGDVMVVNGRSWPVLEVEPRLYRFRFLNGCNARFLILRPDRDGLPFHQIGAEGGLLSGAPVVRDELLIAPGERADVIMDFSGLQVGDEVVIENLGPDEPFGGRAAAQDPADPETTGRVMLLRVVAATGEGQAGAIPETLPAIDPLTTALAPRDLTLNERMANGLGIPSEAKLGTTSGGALDWTDVITENPLVGDTEIWRIANLTGDAHPVHLHLVMFQVLDRIPFDADGYADAQRRYLAAQEPEPLLEDYFLGDPTPPEPAERGWKDTFISNPGEVTRIAATFDMAGLYVWHCHILEHEDNEMMRPFRVSPARQ